MSPGADHEQHGHHTRSRDEKENLARDTQHTQHGYDQHERNGNETLRAGASQDVEEKLASQRRRRRAPGDGVYPVEYTRSLADFDNWAHSSLVALCHGLTMHEFTVPPKRVLDIGCGSGLWILDAAQQWPDSTFVGLDMHNIQPDFDVLADATDMYKDLSKRVKWVHQNFLDRISLQSEQFDYVRICCIGLGVPEDEWPDVLEEAHRMLKPGGVFEITEEDLVFPIGRQPRSIAHTDSTPGVIRMSHSDGSTIHRKSDPTSSHTSSSVLGGHHSSMSNLSTFGGNDTSTLVGSTTSVSSYETEGKPSKSQSQSHIASHSHPDTPSRSSHTSHTSHTQVNVVPVVTVDVRDHTRLKAAWDAMIDKRFLAPQPLSILPLYLSSTFDNIRPHQHLQVPLPSHSAAVRAAVRNGRNVNAVNAMGSMNGMGAMGSMHSVHSMSSMNAMRDRKDSVASSILTSLPSPTGDSDEEEDARYALSTPDEENGTSYFGAGWAAALGLGSGTNTSTGTSTINGASGAGGKGAHTHDVYGMHEAIVGEGHAAANAESSAPMHLARTVAVVQHCKDAVWTEYRTLYAGQLTSGDNTLSEDFEMYWHNWVSDMQDRIGLRSILHAQAGWPEPAVDPDHGPSWQNWRDAVAKVAGHMPRSRAGSVAPGSSSASASASGPPPPVPPVPPVPRVRSLASIPATPSLPSKPSVPSMSSSARSSRDREPRNHRDYDNDSTPLATPMSTSSTFTPPLPPPPTSPRSQIVTRSERSESQSQSQSQFRSTPAPPRIPASAPVPPLSLSLSLNTNFNNGTSTSTGANANTGTSAWGGGSKVVRTPGGGVITGPRTPHTPKHANLCRSLRCFTAFKAPKPTVAE